MLLSADGELDFTQANLDLAIRLGTGAGEHEGVCLAPGEFVRLGQGPAIAWPGCTGDEGTAAHLRVADAGLAIDAAAAGFGSAHVPALLAEADVAAGRVAAGDRSPSALCYWAIAPLPQWRQKKVKALVAALTG